jgi:hypothetical protein
MTAHSLNDLLVISLNGPSLEEFNPSEIVDHWYFSAKTSTNLHEHKRKGDK